MRLLCMLGFAFLFFCPSLFADPIAREVKETKIVDLDITTLPNPAQGLVQWTLATAQLYPGPDLRHVTYIITEGEKSYLARDGVRGAGHDQIRLLPTSLTPDGHFYCWLVDGEQWTLVFDDKEYRAAAPAMLTPFISPDGKHIVYIGKRGKSERCVVLDGVEGKWYYNEIFNPVFSPDSTRLGYGAYTGLHWLVVVDGKELPGEQSAVTACAFSPDSRHFAAVLRINNQYVIQIDGERGKTYDRIEEFSFTADGKPRFAAKTGDRWALITGEEERELPGYSRELRISPDGKHLAYLTGGPRQPAVVIDGVTGPTYSMVRLLPNFFTPDGHTQYMARTQTDWVAVVDGKETPAGELPVFPVTSPDGKRQARQVAVEHKARVVVDGEEGKLYDYVGTPVFSPDSRHLAYFARNGEQTLLVIDGQEGRPCEAVIAPRLSGRRPMAPDADPTPVSPLLSGGVRLFTAADQVRYLIYREKAIYLVEETIK